MKVAFATDDGRLIQTHFGHCESFMIYEITPEKFDLVETRKVGEPENHDEFGRIDKRIEAIQDCILVFITAIGASAAARVTKSKIMPVKVEEGTEILSQLDRLLEMLQKKPPIWLVKAMNQRRGSEEI